MNKGKFLLLALMAMATVSCMNDTVDQPATVDAEAMVAKKFVNTSDNAKAGELVICVDQESVASLEGAEVTRSGMTELDAWAVELGATSIEQVFNMAVNGEQKRAMGMDRWFVVRFSEEANIDVAAQRLAAMDFIERVEFNRVVSRPDVRFTPTPITDEPIMDDTRAEAMPFNDPKLKLQWHYRNFGQETIFPGAVEGEDINVFPAWEITGGRPDVIVAVMDEGIDYTHEDLAANMHINDAELNGESGVDDDGNGYTDDIYGYNFALDSGRVSTGRSGDSGHGTHVAGTVAAVNNNGIGVAGVAGGTGNGDGVRIFSVQIFSGDDGATYTATARGAEYAADRGAAILQCSWGFDANPSLNDSWFTSGQVGVEFEAFKYFMSCKNCPAVDGGLVIFAAGNEAKPVAGYPGAYNEFISVTAYSADGLPTYYTCYDRGCNVSAPGGQYWEVSYGRFSDTGNVLSTLPPALYDGVGYGAMQGTSMACPHVSGMAALAMSYALDLGKTFSLMEFKSLILTSVRAFTNEELTGFKYNPETGGSFNLTSYRNKMGTGKLDAYQLLMAVRGEVCVPIPVGQETTLDFNKFMGDGNLTMKMLSEYEIPEETREALGIVYDTAFGGRLIIECTKPGVGTIKTVYVAGGTAVGGGQITGGLRMEKEFTIIARPNVALDDNGEPIVPGGWL